MLNSKEINDVDELSPFFPLVTYPDKTHKDYYLYKIQQLVCVDVRVKVLRTKMLDGLKNVNN